MAEHGSTRSPQGGSANGHPARHDNTVTDIIPFNEFGDLADLGDDLDFCNSSAFDRESRVMHAPELDDLHDTDDLVPLRLAVPAQFQPELRGDRQPARAYRYSHTDVSDGVAATDVIDMTSRRGVHRKADTGAVKARLVAAAMAAGATAAAAYSVVNNTDTPPEETMLAAGQSAFVDGGAITGSVDGMQIVTVAPVASAAIHSEELANGAAFAAGARGARGAAGTAAVRLSDQGRVDVGLRLPVGRTARRHRHRQLDRHADHTPSPTVS